MAEALSAFPNMMVVGISVLVVEGGVSFLGMPPVVLIFLNYDMVSS